MHQPKSPSFTECYSRYCQQISSTVQHGRMFLKLWLQCAMNLPCHAGVTQQYCPVSQCHYGDRTYRQRLPWPSDRPPVIMQHITGFPPQKLASPWIFFLCNFLHGPATDSWPLCDLYLCAGVLPFSTAHLTGPPPLDYWNGKADKSILN